MDQRYQIVGKILYKESTFSKENVKGEFSKFSDKSHRVQ